MIFKKIKKIRLAKVKKKLFEFAKNIKQRIKSFLPHKKSIAERLLAKFPILKKPGLQLALIVSFTLLVAIGTFATINNYVAQRAYNLGVADSILNPSSQIMADKIKFDSKEKSYTFTNGQTTSVEIAQTGASKIAIVANQDAKKGISVTDSTNNIEFSLTPKFNLLDGKQNGDRIVYPMANNKGWAIYTMKATGAKEDIVLKKASGNDATFEYTLGIGDGLEARIQSDGSIGIYGNTVLSANISTSTESDAALLLKARENAVKDTLIFTIPKPVIIETGKSDSKVTAKYSIDGDNLKLTVSNLNNASYPLSIDPSIYVVTAQQFMNGNNETNINFDVDNKLIKKSGTTGARFDAWNNTTDLTVASWGASSVAAGGYLYSIGGTSFSGQIYNTQGSDTFVVPSGINNITVKMWGGGGGGGAGSASGAGGAGGGSGYVNATIPVTPGESLNIYVGGRGGDGVRNTSGGGGGGGGYSSIYRGSTLLVIAAGGAGGGGARAASVGGYGGAGGGTTGVLGGASGVNNGGNPGTPTAGGTAGTGGTNPGTAGSSLTGGLGGNGRNNNSTDGGAANGGLATGGGGGAVTTTTYGAGGGGGAGFFGGGGGGGSTTATGGSGGGGGSSYTRPTDVTMLFNTAGSGATPGGSADTLRNGAGTGGAAGAANNGGTVGSNGLVAITYGAGGTTVNQSVNWAKFNTTDGTIESADPGSGACSGWCTTAAYNLPARRTNFSLVAYNGFLYVIGGIDETGTRQNTVYIAKLGANGEPQLWSPTSTNKSSWTYWYQDTNISSIRSDMSVVAYNNRMYLMGGRSTGGNPVNTVEIADITPTGKLGTWSSSTNLPSNLYGHSSQVYNDRLYIIGGAATVGGAPSNSVYYVKINSTGTLNNWIQTSSFSTGRIGNGGNFSVVWGAYIYISGGCSTVNASGYCTTIQSDTQVSSINADGSIDVWNNLGGISSQRMSFSMISWRDRIYEIGGCSAQNSTTGDCNSAMLSSIIYGNVNQDGDASTVDQSVALNTAPCSGTDPVGCNLPGNTYIGNMLSSTIIVNGYLYVIGGCTNNTCSTTIGNVAYVAISSTGTMVKPATCPSGAYQGGTWCVDTTHTIAGGIGAASTVAFNNQIYLVGGLDGGGNTDTIYRTTLNNDGSIGAWQSQTMSGVGATAQSYLFSFARANPSDATNNPGNLYIFGGCATSSSAGCTAYGTGVYKCNIQATTGAIAGCTTAGQLQIGKVPGDTANTGGMGIMSGTVYANYVYLVGGVTPDQVDLKTIMYAQIDTNNNIVLVPSYPAGSLLTTAIGTGLPTGTGAGWVQSAQKMEIGRRRSAAFGYNGYIYAVGGYEAVSGVLADIEFIKVNVSDGSVGSAADPWHTSVVQINQRWGLSVPVSNSFAYVIGGCTAGASPSNCTTRTDVIQTFQLYNNDSGSPAGFSTSAATYSTNPNRLGASSTIVNGYIYVAGGCISATDCATAIDTVSYAALDANGTIGTWYDTTAHLPAVRAWGKLETAGGSLYYIGGQSSTATDRRTEVYYATPASGNITSWGTANNGIPAARTKFGSAVWNNRLYVVGGEGTGTGCTASNVCNTVYVSPLLNSGGNINSAWSSASTSFNVARSGAAAVAYANNLYIFGGFDGANYLSDSQYTHIISAVDATDGTVGSWKYSTSLPGPLSQADGFGANGYIYIAGGRSNATTCDPIMLATPVSANTTIATGNNPTGIGEWFETNQRYTGARYGASAVYYDGKAYVIGGSSCQLTSTQQVLSTTGASSFVVPDGITSITTKIWSGAGGGGAGGSAATGGAGGGSGYVNATIAVTPGETLTTYVGSGGGAGARNTAGGGGGGGGYSSIYRGATLLALVGGGGGGGGGRATASHTGGAGGGGGGLNGVAGANAGGTGTTVTGGGFGTPTTGGAAGANGQNNGTAGASLTGGLGANGLNISGADGGAANGGAATGGAGGSVTSVTYAGGGGGGSGYFGGGGGSGTNVAVTSGGSGGGGGSSYTNPTGITLIENLAGSGTAPGKSGDVDQSGAGIGGNGGAVAGVGTAGANGRIVISYNTLAYSTPVIQQTALLSQPQVAKYSIMIDTDSDVFPSNWLLNGVDNSIGAKWQLRYRSMTNITTSCKSPAMTTWGSETIFGDVTLGLPGVYIPKDSGGVTTNCARFFYFNITVDSSQAFGYPDDVSRGPTITDLTLQFSADPSKRLMHGRTFTGGLQQPIDTPYYTY